MHSKFEAIWCTARNYFHKQLVTKTSGGAKFSCNSHDITQCHLTKWTLIIQMVLELSPTFLPAALWHPTQLEVVTVQQQQWRLFQTGKQGTDPMNKDVLPNLSSCEVIPGLWISWCQCCPKEAAGLTSQAAQSRDLVLNLFKIPIFLHDCKFKIRQPELSGAPLAMREGTEGNEAYSCHPCLAAGSWSWGQS